MNTIVWVMLVYSHAGNWIPTIEFKDEKKCMIAAHELKAAVDGAKGWGSSGMNQPKCVRIEK